MDPAGAHFGTMDPRDDSAPKRRQTAGPAPDPTLLPTRDEIQSRFAATPSESNTSSASRVSRVSVDSGTANALIAQIADKTNPFTAQLAKAAVDGLGTLAGCVSGGRRRPIQTRRVENGRVLLLTLPVRSGAIRARARQSEPLEWSLRHEAQVVETVRQRLRRWTQGQQYGELAEYVDLKIQTQVRREEAEPGEQGRPFVETLFQLYLPILQVAPRAPAGGGAGDA